MDSVQSATFSIVNDISNNYLVEQGNTLIFKLQTLQIPILRYTICFTRINSEGPQIEPFLNCRKCRKSDQIWNYGSIVEEEAYSRIMSSIP